MEGVPGYVSVSFILTTFLAIGFLFYAIKQTTLETTAAKIVVAATTFWLMFTGILAISGFYLETRGFPPRFTFVPIPALIFIAFLFVFYRTSFIGKLPLQLLTMLHIVRIPVEIILWLLYENGQIPEVMTFEGRNFDILAGISAPIIAWLAFRSGKVNRRLLIIWNFVCLALLANIVVTAILSLPTDFQTFGLEQPNRGVLNFPYIWLPAIVVPIVIFAHAASIWKIFKNNVT